jgi:hypothetical protein
MSNKLPDFLCVPCAIIKNKEMTSLDGLVYGTIYWYARQKLEKCILSNPTFADLLGVDARSIQRSLARLEKNGYIKAVYKDTNEKQRLEIIPLITFQSYPEKQDTTLQSYQKEQGTTSGSYEPSSKSTGTTTESYQYDPTVIPVRPEGHTDTTLQSYPVEAEVRPYGHQNNIENIKEERVKKKGAVASSAKKLSKDAEDYYDDFISKFLERFNQVKGTKFIAIKPLRANFRYWISIYDFEIMLIAVENMRLSNFWMTKGTPEMLLRRMNPRREEIDYIGELYNLRIEPMQKISKKKNATQEYLSGEAPLEYDQREEGYGQTASLF